MISKNTLIICFIFAFLCQQSICGQFHLRRDPFEIAHQQYLINGNQHLRSSNSIGGSIVGFIMSPVLFILSFILIWNNQRKAAIDQRRVELAQTLVRTINPSNFEQIRQSDGQLVHVSGKTETNQAVFDNETGISINNAIKIKREVEVREYRSTGSDNNRTYQLQWVSSNLQSAGDGHNNDASNWFIKTQVTKNKNVMLANYILSQSLIDQLSYQEVYKPTLQEAYNIGRNSNGRVKNEPFVSNQYMYFPSVPGSSDAPGTLRIKYQICRPGDTSVISQSQKNTFTPFRIDIQQNGRPDEDEELGGCCCFLSNCTAQLFSPLRQINFIEQKTQSSGQMIQDYIKQINCKKNLIRFACYFLMVFSICSFFSPITTILGYIPLLGGFLKGVVGLAIFLAALIVALPLFILAVSISWLRFHPKVGLLIFGVGLLIAGIVIFIIIKNRPDNPQVETVKHHFHRI